MIDLKIDAQIDLNVYKKAHTELNLRLSSANLFHEKKKEFYSSLQWNFVEHTKPSSSRSNHLSKVNPNDTHTHMYNITTDKKACM